MQSLWALNSYYWRVPTLGTFRFCFSIHAWFVSHMCNWFFLWCLDYLCFVESFHAASVAQSHSYCLCSSWVFSCLWLLPLQEKQIIKTEEMLRGGTAAGQRGSRLCGDCSELKQLHLCIHYNYLRHIYISVPDTERFLKWKMCVRLF